MDQDEVVGIGVDAMSPPANASNETFFELGLMYACGRSGAPDLVSAHKWFNIAAMKGHSDAARMRREIAAEMTDAEIGGAQRAARDWLNSQPPVAIVELRAAA
jgi:TPR repeat protein